jgi:hypothetical protein
MFLVGWQKACFNALLQDIGIFAGYWHFSPLDVSLLSTLLKQREASLCDAETHSKR